MKKKWLTLSSFILTIILVLSACGNQGGSGDEKNNAGSSGIGQKKLTMPYVSWASATAGVNVMKVVLENVGYDINLKQVSAGTLFASLADDSGDISVGTVTLPYTHASYWEKYGDQIVDLGGTDLKAPMGLVVPKYVKINSIEDLAKNTNNIGNKTERKLVGIDPGAGEMKVTKNKVMPKYGLDKWTLQSSSGPTMTAALSKAIKAHKPIIVTLWKPHWAFLEWDLKILKDPKNIYGDPDTIHTAVRQGLKKDAPAAYKILDQFHWTADDIGKVMIMIHDGMDPNKAAQKFVKNHQDLVSEWTKGVEIAQ